MKMVRFNLSLSEETYKNLKAVSSSRGVTVTHTLRQMAMTLNESVSTGQRKCISGESCIMGFMPSIQDKSRIS